LAQAKMEMDKRETQQATETLGKVVQLLPAYAEGHSMLAQALAEQGDLDRSIAEYKQALELQPNLYPARLGLGQVLHTKGDLAQAISAFREAIRLRPSSAEAYTQLGLALSEKGDRNGSAAAFKKVLQLDPGNARAQESLDAILKESALAQNAHADSGSNLVSEPRSSTDEPILRADGDDLDEIQSFEGLVEQEKWDRVEPLLLIYIKEHPNSWRAHYIQGYVLFRIYKVGDSIRELAKSLESNVNNPEAHKILGKDFVVIGKYDYAQTELEQAARLKPESAEIHYSLGEVYSVRDMFPAAKAEFVKAIGLDPKYPEAHNALGFTEESLGDDRAALEAYQKAIQFADEKGLKFDPPRVNLSAYYNRQIKPELALQYGQEAINMNPKSDLGYYQIARAYQSINKWDQAAEALRNAVSIKPSSAQYYYVLSEVYRRLGKPEQSRAALDTFQKLKHDSDDIENKVRDTHQLSVSDSESIKRQ